MTEVDIQLAPGQRYLPDLAGWRMERVTAADLNTMPTRVAPDWVCEILSPSTASRDLGTKKRNYHLSGDAWNG
ncbi:MAG: Uma2 family endonuclease [Proteobacteria bacterium]|nr:Uma2 family endonuclease [Pseudomonadota bacterium]